MAKSIICATLLAEKSPQALPLGCACIASSLKHSPFLKDFSVKLLYQSLEEEFTLPEKIVSFGKPSYLVLSVFVWNRKALEDTAFYVKKIFPDTVVIAGGPEVTSSVKPFKNFDWGVKGAGEEAVCSLVMLLEKYGKDILKFKNELPVGVYKNEQFFLQNKNRTQPVNVEKLSSPYLDGTLSVKKFEGSLWELARGCPFNCSYCYESKGEKKIQYFPESRLVKELQFFKKEKIRQVFVLDPTYNINKERSIHLITLIEKYAPGIFFYFEVRAEFIDRALSKAFTRIPCALQIGLQSSNLQVLKNVNRTFDEKKFKRNVGYLNEDGVVFGFDLIYGLPGDNLEGFKKSVDFALSLYPNNLETFPLSVLAGTDLYENASSFFLEFQENPPYHLIKSNTFSEEEMKKAQMLSFSINLFYNQGRAVSWFLSAVKFLHKTPSSVLEEFYTWFVNNKNNGKNPEFDECISFSHRQIEKMQIEFFQEVFKSKSKEKFFTPFSDLIKFYAAVSRVSFDSIEETVSFSYSPDEIATPYALDIKFFTEHFKKKPCRVKFFLKEFDSTGKKDVFWKILSR